MGSLLAGLNPWYAAIPLVVGAVFLTFGVTTLSRSRRRRRSWTRRTGLVVGSRLSDGTVQSQVRFIDDAGPVTFWNRYTSSFGVDKVGREVEVLVNPQNRADAVIAGGSASALTLGVAFAVFGVIALVVGVAVLIGVSFLGQVR